MGKDTGRMRGLVSLVAAGVLCWAGTVAYAATLTVSNPKGIAGSQQSFAVTLGTGGTMVGGAQADIGFGAPLSLPSAPSGTGTCTMGKCNKTTTTTCSSTTDCPKGTCSVTTTTQCHADSDCATGETCQNAENCVLACLSNSECASGATCTIATGPQCTAGSGLPVNALFSFLKTAGCTDPTSCGCTPGTDCTAIRAVIAGVDPASLGPLTDGSTLYNCMVSIGSGASEGTSPLTISNVQVSDQTGTAVTATGTPGMVTICPPTGCPPAGFEVCDVVPFTGDNAGEFGGSGIKNNDVVAIFNASLGSGTVPADGTARFDAMDSITVDTPPTCGGNGKLVNNDVVACFNRSLGVGDNFSRTITDSTCTSMLVPQ